MEGGNRNRDRLSPKVPELREFKNMILKTTLTILNIGSQRVALKFLLSLVKYWLEKKN